MARSVVPSAPLPRTGRTGGLAVAGLGDRVAVVLRGLRHGLVVAACGASLDAAAQLVGEGGCRRHRASVVASGTDVGRAGAVGDYSATTLERVGLNGRRVAEDTATAGVALVRPDGLGGSACRFLLDASQGTGAVLSKDVARLGWPRLAVWGRVGVEGGQGPGDGVDLSLVLDGPRTRTIPELTCENRRMATRREVMREWFRMLKHGFAELPWHARWNGTPLWRLSIYCWCISAAGLIFVVVSDETAYDVVGALLVGYGWAFMAAAFGVTIERASNVRAVRREPDPAVRERLLVGLNEGAERYEAFWKMIAALAVPIAVGVFAAVAVLAD
jgi:hypothetical protein